MSYNKKEDSYTLIGSTNYDSFHQLDAHFNSILNIFCSLHLFKVDQMTL